MYLDINHFMYNIVLKSVVGWEVINKCFYLYNNKDREYNSRYLSNIHALMITIVSFYNCFITKIINDNMDIYFSISLGYAIFDSYRAFKKKETEYIVHHLIMIISLFPIILNYYNLIILNNLYYYFISRAFLSESSTIFLNNCWLSIKQNKNHNIEFKINSLLLIVLFFLFRIVNFTNLIYSIYGTEYNKFLILHLPLTFLNYIWFYKLIKKSLEIF